MDRITRLTSSVRGRFTTRYAMVYRGTEQCGERGNLMQKRRDTRRKAERERAFASAPLPQNPGEGSGWGLSGRNQSGAKDTFSLLHRHTFGEVARLVYLATFVRTRANYNCHTFLSLFSKSFCLLAMTCGVHCISFKTCEVSANVVMPPLAMKYFRFFKSKSKFCA